MSPIKCAIPCLAALPLVATMPVALSTISVSRAASDIVVHQKDRTFLPGALTLVRGSVVRFVNDEAVIHHAFVDTPRFSADSGDIQPGGEATLRFDAEGRFLVRCAIHPAMRIEVTVQP